MVAIALKIIEQKEGPFDPAKFVDRYEEALKALIATKQKGQKPVAAEAPEDTNVIDLMAALRASLKHASLKHNGPKKPAAAPRTKAAAAKAVSARRKAR